MHSAYRHLRTNRRLIASLSGLVLLPLIFNLVVMAIEKGSRAIAPVIAGVLLPLAGLSLLATAVALAAVYLSKRAFLLRLPKPVSLISRVLLAVSVGMLFRDVAGLIMPLVWLPLFGDYLLGLPVSPLADSGSWYVVFPLVVVIFSIAAVSPTGVDGKQTSPTSINEAA